MPPPPRVDVDALTRDQALSHASSVNLAAAGMAVVILFLGLAYAPILPISTLTVWLAGLGAPFTLRVLLARAYHQQPDRHAAAVWVRRFRFTFALHGAAWAAASVFVFPAVGTADRAALAFVVAGVTASALNTAAFDLVAGLTVLGVSVAPWSLRMLLEGGRVYGTIGAMLALFLVYMTVNGLRINRRYLEAIGLRHAAAERAGALAAFQASFARLWQAEQTSPGGLVAGVTREVATVLGLTRARLFQFDDESGVATLVATTGPAAVAAETVMPLTAIAPYLAALASTGRLESDGVSSSAGLESAITTALAFTPGAARIDVPLGSAGHIGGVLSCERAPGPWTDDEITFLTAAAATLQAAAEESRRRLAEGRLRDLNQNLEALVAARTSALQASEARLALTLDATNDGLWDFDLATGGVHFSPVWARLLGYAPEEIAQRVETFWEHVHPDDAARVQSVLDQHLSGRLPTKELEVRLRMKSGEYRWFLDQGKVVERAADGTPLRMVGTISDITERKRMLEDLHESDSRFRALFDKSPVVVTLVDMAASRIAEMNEVGLRTFGYTREDVLGRTTFELGFWADEEARRAAARQLMATGFISGVEIELARKNGEVFWALLSSTLVSFQGQPYALATVQDITERRRLEARVLQSQKMEVVGHLAGGIAHDFNNVLTVITSTAEMALSGTRDGDPMFDALQTISAASTRAARLTGQLLAFSRQQILQPALLDLNDVVMELAPMVRRVVGEQVRLDLHPAPQPVTLRADRGNLEQVVLNLAINARDAMPDGGTLTIAVAIGAVDASAGTTLADGTYAQLTVTDTGTGMNDATLERIFEPFFTTKDVGRGTGLGLSMVHGVVQQSGGDIVVRSAPGAGTTFTIYLPLAAGTPVAVAPAPRVVETGHEAVLVVDDDADIRKVLKRALSFAGYDVLLASDGREALDLLDREGGRVRMLLTDVMMPGIGGRELAERVRSRHPGVRILFSSGYAENAIAHHGVLSEGVQFIAKPYSLQALTRKVRDVLDA